jgi:hypothetical protein
MLLVLDVLGNISRRRKGAEKKGRVERDGTHGNRQMWFFCDEAGAVSSTAMGTEKPFNNE